jgi:hypothetical protein
MQNNMSFLGSRAPAVSRKFPASQKNYPYDSGMVIPEDFAVNPFAYLPYGLAFFCNIPAEARRRFIREAYPVAQDYQIEEMAQRVDKICYERERARAAMFHPGGQVTATVSPTPLQYGLFVVAGATGGYLIGRQMKHPRKRRSKR